MGRCRETWGDMGGYGGVHLEHRVYGGVLVGDEALGRPRGKRLVRVRVRAWARARVSQT